MAKPLILIVDDEAAARTLLTHFLTHYNTLEASSGYEAIRIISEHSRLFGFGQNKIDAIILDNRLPDEDTHSFLKKLARLGQKAANIPLITCSAVPIPPIDAPNWKGQVEKTDQAGLLALLELSVK